MAISHIGRLLRQRAEQERLKTAFGLLEGLANSKSLEYFQGYAEGIKWAMNEIENIESEGN